MKNGIKLFWGELFYVCPNGIEPMGNRMLPLWISFSLGPRNVRSVSRSVLSDSLQLNRLQPSRFLCPWDFPGKNTGVGYHFLLQLPQILLQIISSGFDLEVFALYRGSWVTGLLLNVSLSLMSSGISFLIQDSSVSRLRFIAAGGDIIPCLTLWHLVLRASVLEK